MSYHGNLHRELSEVQGTLYDIGCGLLPPLVEKGPQVGKMPFSYSLGGDGS